MPPYAHTPAVPGGPWNDLDDHLKRVAAGARALAEPFGAGDVAYLIGLWHDVGKCNPAFQSYLRAQSEGRSHPQVPHAIWGAALAYDVHWRVLGHREHWKEVALPILGHHGGLSNAGLAASDLEDFIQSRPEALEQARLLASCLPGPPSLRFVSRTPTDRELALRMPSRP